MAPPADTMEQRLMLLEDHEKSKQPSCNEFHKCVYGFMNDYKPHIESWAGFKRWLVGAAIVLILMAAGIYKSAIEVGYRLASLEHKMEIGIPSSAYDSGPPQEGATPIPPEARP